MPIIKALLFIFISLGCLHTQASIALRSKNYSPVSKPNAPQSLNLKAKKIFKTQRSIISSKDLEKIIPLDRNQNSNTIAKKILSNATQAFMKSSFIQNSFLGKTAKSVKKATSVDVDLKANTQSSLTKKIDHKVNFQIQAFKQSAKLTYKGYMNSKLEYLANEGALNLSIEEKLSQNSKIALSHKTLARGSEQMLNFEVNW